MEAKQSSDQKPIDNDNECSVTDLYPRTHFNEDQTDVDLNVDDIKAETDKTKTIDVTPDKDGGVIKEIIKHGKGFKTPADGDKVFIHYVGKLLDGTVFDSSFERRNRFSFTLGKREVIKGLDLAVKTMKSGELANVTIRSEYAYGETGSPPKIPPNTTLVFEVELFSWKMVDVTKKEDGGVLKRILVEGEGYALPNEGAAVNVEFTGYYQDRILEQRQLSFDYGEGSEYNIIEGIELGIGKMKKGEKCKLFIKREYAWKDSPPSEFNLPPDYDQVIYELHLISFDKMKGVWEMTTEEKIEQAEVAKNKGSEYFKKNKYRMALLQYKRIPKYLGYSDEQQSDDEEDSDEKTDKELNPSKKTKKDSILLAGYLNLALVYLKLNQPLEVIKNCTNALEMDQNNTKGFFRRSIGYYQIQEYDKSIADLEKIFEIEPENKAAANQLLISKNALKKQKEKLNTMYKNMFSIFLKKDTDEDKQENGTKDVWNSLKDESEREFKASEEGKAC